MSNNIGLNIKKYRKEKGLTQTELADKLGKTLRTVQKYKSGEDDYIWIMPYITCVLSIERIDKILANIKKDGDENKKK